jgi:hypothetical protein
MATTLYKDTYEEYITEFNECFKNLSYEDKEIVSMLMENIDDKLPPFGDLMDIMNHYINEMDIGDKAEPLKIRLYLSFYSLKKYQEEQQAIIDMFNTYVWEHRDKNEVNAFFDGVDKMESDFLKFVKQNPEIDNTKDLWDQFAKENNYQQLDKLKAQIVSVLY